MRIPLLVGGPLQQSVLDDLHEAPEDLCILRREQEEKGLPEGLRNRSSRLARFLLALLLPFFTVSRSSHQSVSIPAPQIRRRVRCLWFGSQSPLEEPDGPVGRRGESGVVVGRLPGHPVPNLQDRESGVGANLALEDVSQQACFLASRFWQAPRDLPERRTMPAGR